MPHFRKTGQGAPPERRQAMLAVMLQTGAFIGAVALVILLLTIGLHEGVSA